MNESVFYFRGPFPFGPENKITKQMVRDAKILVEIPKENLDSMHGDLLGQSDFVDPKRLAQILGRHLGDAAKARRLARFISVSRNQQRITNRTIEEWVERIEAWTASDENKNENLLSEDDLDVLKHRLPMFLGPMPCLERQAKAERLANITGHPLENLQIICDLRPIFDDTRESVEGMIPYTILKVVCTGEDGMPLSLEAILSETDVDRLAEGAEKAKKKLAGIRATLKEAGIDVPVTDLTNREATDAD